MYLSLKNSTFVRFYDAIAYITHQFTHKDRVYDEIGKIFLQHLSRYPNSKTEIVDKLSHIFYDVDRKDLESDFDEFIDDLHLNGFINISEKLYPQEKGSDFTYRDFNLREIVINSYQEEKNSIGSSSDFLHNYFRENPTIFGVHFEITSKCNERCLHCYIPENIGRQDIDVDFAIDLLNQLRDIGTLSVTFSGGEPFLHPQFYKILKHARENDFIINILSNGTKIDKDRISFLRELNIAKIQVSLYSWDALIHDTITQKPGSYLITKSNIELLVKNQIPVQISCPIVKLNKDSYKDVLKWGKKIGVRVLSDFILMGKYDCDTSNLDLRLDIIETEEIIRAIIKEEDEYRAIFEKKQPEEFINQTAEIPICGIGVDNVCISKDGILYPCSGFQGIELGDARNQSLLEIWTNSPHLNKFRNMKRSCFEKCNNCEAMNYCVMCLVRNYNEHNGDMFKINTHYCDVAFLTKKLVEDEFFNKR
jgi:radical SAM protein with 4Fe4S-binding SPASM domain